MKIVGQGGQAAGKMGVGNLDQPEFAHASVLTVTGLAEGETRWLGAASLHPNGSAHSTR
jgi:hypothetical protein